MNQVLIDCPIRTYLISKTPFREEPLFLYCAEEIEIP